MRKIAGWVVGLMLLLGAQSVVAAPVVNPVDQLTGAVWMQSSLENKKALIYGVECAITIEYFVAEKMAEQGKAKGKKGKQSQHTFSPFEKGWTTAFQGVSRDTIVKDVDAWYTAHPDQMDRPVFSVLWQEFIVPKLQ